MLYMLCSVTQLMHIGFRYCKPFSSLKSNQLWTFLMGMKLTVRIENEQALFFKVKKETLTEISNSHCSSFPVPSLVSSEHSEAAAGGGSSRARCPRCCGYCRSPSTRFFRTAPAQQGHRVIAALPRAPQLSLRHPPPTDTESEELCLQIPWLIDHNAQRNNCA